MPRITIAVPGQVPQPYRLSLDRQVVHFGRGVDNDIIINCPSVSSEHAAMERTIGGYVLSDLGSTNGIKLSGEKVSKIQLRNGQLIKLGDVDFCFQLSDEEQQLLYKEDPTSRLPPMPGEDQAQGKPAGGPSPASEPKPTESKTPTSQLSTITQSFKDEDFIDLDAVELEAAPKPKRRPAASGSQPIAPRVQPLPRPSGGYGVVLLLAIVAFLVGVGMHFQRATGKSIIEAIEEKINGPLPPAAQP